MVCRIDTVSLYTQPTANLIFTNASQWRYFKKSDIMDCHYFIRYKSVTVRYYPYRNQLWVTFSIPKLLQGNNVFPVDMDNLDRILFDRIDGILSEIIVYPFLPSVCDWQVSRADLFFLHHIQPGKRTWYMDAYSHLTLGSYVPYRYQTDGTFYLNSTLKKHRAAGTVIRVYAKLKEIQDTSDMPKGVNDDFEFYLEICEKLNDYIRFEFQFRRQVLKYYLHQKSVTLADVMQEQFQVDRINKMVLRLGLNLRIISRKHMQEQLNLIFPKAPTRQRAKQYIRLVNGRGTYTKTIKSTFTESQIRYIRKRLYDNGLHCVVSEFEDLQPIQPLK